MNERDFNDHTLCSYYGLTLAQVERLPNYIIDAMTGALCDLKNTKAKLANAEGLKPVDHREAHRTPGVVVETDEGEYVFPFHGWRNCRAEVSIHFPDPDDPDRVVGRVTLSSRDVTDGQADIGADYHFGSLAILPRASNCFTLVEMERD